MPQAEIIPILPGFDKVASFLNSNYFIGGLLTLSALIGAVIVLVLLYHWGAYRPRAAFRLGEGERVIKIFHKHWFMFLLDLLLLGFIWIAPIVLFYVFPSVWLGFLSGAPNFVSAITFIWTGFIALGILVVATNYFLDTWILTNKRMIDVEQKGLFNRDIAEISLDRIQDIRILVPGFIKSILHIGNVYIQSAGASREFVITDVARPEQVKNLVGEAHRKKLDEVREVRVVS
jgi:hypothetical protein